MKILDLTFKTPEENLACDEALLASSEANPPDEILRFWEPDVFFVVLGYSRRFRFDVNCAFCRKHNIPILRRISGGGTVLQGPGCLNFTLILNTGKNHRLSTISEANSYVLSKHKEALEAVIGREVAIQGISDLALGDMKFSGNSQRREKNRILFQGSFLVSAKLKMIEKALEIPDRQPRYRKNRPHSDFLINLGTNPARIKEAMAKAWMAHSALDDVPHERIRELTLTKYSRKEWNFKF